MLLIAGTERADAAENGCHIVVEAGSPESPLSHRVSPPFATQRVNDDSHPSPREWEEAHRRGAAERKLAGAP